MARRILASSFYGPPHLLGDPLCTQVKAEWPASPAPSAGDAVLHMLFLLASLFLLAVAVAALVFFPDLRQHLSQRLGASALQLQRQGTSTGEALRARTGAAGVLLGQEMGRWGGMAWRRRQLLALSLLALLLLPGAAVWWRLSHRVDSYDHTVAQDVDEHVAMLLQGEQLVPPPPLPPVLFRRRRSTNGIRWLSRRAGNGSCWTATSDRGCSRCFG